MNAAGRLLRAAARVCRTRYPGFIFGRSPSRAAQRVLDGALERRGVLPDRLRPRRIGCSEPDFWDNGPFYDRLTGIHQIGVESNADRIGGTAATIVGVGIAAHAGLNALRQARVKSQEAREQTGERA